MKLLLLPFGPGKHEIFCVLFKNEVSVSPSPVGLLQLSPTDHQSQVLWGHLFLMMDPCQSGKPDIGLRTLTPVGEPLQFN